MKTGKQMCKQDVATWLWFGSLNLYLRYLCNASKDASPAGPLRRWWGSWRPPRPGLDVTGRPWKGGSAPACEKKAAWAAAAGLLRAINCAAIGLRPGGCGPNPLPKGDLSRRGSVKKNEFWFFRFCHSVSKEFCTSKSIIIYFTSLPLVLLLCCDTGHGWDSRNFSVSIFPQFVLWISALIISIVPYYSLRCKHFIF